MHGLQPSFLSLSFTVSPNRLKHRDKKSVEPARLASYSCAPLLISSICFQRQLLQLCRPPTIPFQQHLTLPNPHPSVHPDIANVAPGCPSQWAREGLIMPKPPPFASPATC